MARKINLLNARAIATVSKPGHYADGGRLYLCVRVRVDSPERLWIFRYKLGAREVTLSIGLGRDVWLAQAREVAGRCRAALAKGDLREEQSIMRGDDITQVSDARHSPSCFESALV
ncbi:MAG TPA: Arm DNA-binding domain-containing protein [Hyphomicrobium sp.]|jgi:hypothetical protein|nr:Arm DNA-binding domain-containing protein [Hyphomicrobium sp.]